jgi:hypothetical protein
MVMVMAVLDPAGIGGVILIGLSDVVDDRGFMLLVFRGCEVCCISVVEESNCTLFVFICMTGVCGGDCVGGSRFPINIELDAVITVYYGDV